jgi:NTE family protein
MSGLLDAIDPKRRWMRRLGVLIFVALLAGCASSPQLPRSEVGEFVSTLPVGDESRIGLALGGGAARGFAHVGVIQVLEDAGIRPQFVVGTSAGSLVAALYASGMQATELKKTAISMQEAAITDWLLPIFNRGALKGDALAQYVNQQVQGRSIENMSLPLGIVATDLRTGEAVVFRRGNTGTAVRASSAVPGVFLPVKIGDREYVDGGLVAPVPVQQARQMGANFVIAVDISSDPQSGETGDVFKILLQTFTIMGRSINALALRQADLVVRPSLNGVGSADFTSRERSIELGRQAMLAALPLLRQKLAELKR